MTAKRTIKIPELEELIVPCRFWTEEEIEILRAYYNRVPSKHLVEYINKKYNTHRTLGSLRKKAQEVCRTDISRTKIED